MEMRWSLKELYNSFDDEQFKSDFTKINEIIKNINEFTANELVNYNNTGNKIEEIISSFITYYKTYSLLRTYTFLSLSTDARNEQAAKLLEKLNQKDTELTKSKVKIEKWLAGVSSMEEYVKESKLIEEHKFFLEELLEKSKYLLSEKEELIISKMRNTGSRAWTKLQQDLTSTLMIKVEINGETKELPLPVVRNMAYKKDPQIRKNAYHAELSAYEKIDESVAASLNGIKGEVITTTELRGYKSPLEKTLLDSRMKKETIDTMFHAIKESLPVFRSYYRHKAELLGHDKGLPFYDVFAPVAEVDMNFTYSEARDFIVENFRSFSDSMADYAANAFEKKWIDAEPREGKRGGAFCSNIHPIGESRILANFTGSYNDVSTLAHELGHGYHGYCLKDASILNSDYPMPLAETASIFCQTIVDLAAIEQSDSDNALAILESSISD
ncbi:MAG: M3 family metallopeptidase, partial [bacterium]